MTVKVRAHDKPSETARGRRCMVVIPCLNEADHIGPLIAQLLRPAERLDMIIVVADGGSTDGTVRVVQEIAAGTPRVILLDNPGKLQAVAVNLAVSTYGDGFARFIRIDAHGGYPDDYCERLIEEADATGADSVVVSMITKGFGPFQRATAVAQNSRLGNGGSPHRAGMEGHWADHGHHALMAVAAFRAIGGYDESFSHNEDAELDVRLRAAGYRIWMTDKTVMTYYPRASAGSLFRQYLGYGRGRAKNILKHRAMPKIRQIVPLMVLPVVAGALLAFVSLSTLIPVGLWMAVCMGYGIWLALAERNPYGPLAGVSAMIMHLAWSAGFWMQLALSWKREASPS
jgi:succinoglycan biosynthesis protein ExoA